MNTMELDPRLTFETFVVGPANRLAAAAARRAADSPGTNYNPLFLYSDSGLGKSHILSAIAHRSQKNHPEREVMYQPLEVHLGELTQALERGEDQDLRSRYEALDILLLDDVQFLTGQNQAQEMLLRTIDRITARGGQVVLASDRPPSEIDGLDSRLLSRFSGGLIVDIGTPDLETRVAILHRKTEARGGMLEPGVAEALARTPFRNVRELQGALNRVLVLQELEGRPVSVEELPSVVGTTGSGGEVRTSSDPVPSTQPEWRRKVEAARSRAEGAGFITRRLDRLLGSSGKPQDWEQVLRRFRLDTERSLEIREQLDLLGNPWPEAAVTLLRDPDRLEESEALLASARERNRPFAHIGEGPTLEDLKGTVPALALRAADRLLRADRPDYNPLYLHAVDSEFAHGLLEAVGRTHLERNPDARVGLISVSAFAEEFIRAISDGVAGAWRERWWSVEVLLLHDLEDLTNLERAQDEFFHLFEALRRRNSRIFLACDRPPSAIRAVDDRLRSRFEGGLVLDLGEGRLPEWSQPHRDAMDVASTSGKDASASRLPSTTATEVSESGPSPGDGAATTPTLPDGAKIPPAGPITAPSLADPDGDDHLAVLRELAGVGRIGGEGGSDRGGDGPAQASDRPVSDSGSPDRGWSPSRERVVWDWPSVEERIVEGF
jgi:chromosomal replication initiator protein